MWLLSGFNQYLIPVLKQQDCDLQNQRIETSVLEEAFKDEVQMST